MGPLPNDLDMDLREGHMMNAMAGQFHPTMGA